MGRINLDGLNNLLGAMLSRGGDMNEPLREVGFAMENEMRKNFEAGGRPTKWKPSIRVKVSGGQTLRDRGDLMNSITSNVDGSSVSAGPGSGVAFKARILALGGTIKAKNKPFLKFRIPGVGFVQKKEVTIPARDYTYIPPEAQETMGEIIRRHVLST